MMKPSLWIEYCWEVEIHAYKLGNIPFGMLFLLRRCRLFIEKPTTVRNDLHNHKYYQNCEQYILYYYYYKWSTRFNPIRSSILIEAMPTF